jgi:competence protein ComGC
MSLKKKVLLGVFIAVVVIGSIGGIVAANTVSESTGTTVPTITNEQDTLLEKVAAKLGVSVESLTTAFQEARVEIRQERLDACLAQLVANGDITQEQADAYKAWLNSRPSDQEYQDALQAWQDANPLAGLDIPLPGMGNPGGSDENPGMRGGPGPMGDGFNCPMDR